MVLPEQQRETDYIYSLTERILNYIREEDYLGMLNETDVLLKFLEDNFKIEQSLEKLEKEIHTLLLDESRMRIVKLLQSVKTEQDTKIEYYDIDRGIDERLKYRGTVEKELLTLQEKIRDMISKVLKNKSRIDYG